MTRIKCRCDSCHQKKRPPPEGGGPKKWRAGPATGAGLRPGYRRPPAAEPGLAMEVLRARKVAGKPTVAIPQTAGGLSEARFRRTEPPSRYRLLDREVEAGHHPNDGRRRHQFPASNGLSRCSGQSRALMEIPRRRWDLRPYPTPGCRDSPGLPALQTSKFGPGLLPRARLQNTSRPGGGV